LMAQLAGGGENLHSTTFGSWRGPSRTLTLPREHHRGRGKSKMIRRKLINHLWQSTLFAGVVAWLLTIAFRKNRGPRPVIGLWAERGRSNSLFPFSLLMRPRHTTWSGRRLQRRLRRPRRLAGDQASYPNHFPKRSCFAPSTGGTPYGVPIVIPPDSDWPCVACGFSGGSADTIFEAGAASGLLYASSASG